MVHQFTLTTVSRMPATPALDFSNKLILAPLAGISDRPFRRLCRSFGAELAVSEMISAKGLVYGDRKSRILLAPDASDRPHWVQLFGTDPEIIREAAAIAIEHGAELIDLNMGCPVRKVVKTGAGAALLKDPARAAAIMRALSRPPAIPFTVKIRTGWDPRRPVLEIFIRLAAEFGARALTCHPRTATQMFSGRADWKRLVKAAGKTPANLPIIGSGDLREPQEVAGALEKPGIAAVMLGRGTLGRPWLFRECRRLIEKRQAWQPEAALKLKTIREHGTLLKAEYGDKTGLLLYRKHLAWYIRGVPGAAAFRSRLFTLKSFAELDKALAGVFHGPG